jgi:hypothetical protein
MRLINESLDHLDMEGHVTTILGIDEYKSQIGQDSDIVVLNFLVSGEQVGNDLVDWLERGYDWIIDAEVSPGEVFGSKYMVFAEMNRRSTAPRRIMEILDDLKTLVGVDSSEWQLKIDGKKIPASIEAIHNNVILDANEYRANEEQELNEWREIAGLTTVKTQEIDEDLVAWQRQAGIK